MRVPVPASANEVLTIGHSNRPLTEFLEALQMHGATLLVDVRKMPRSLRNPQFNRETLPESLEAAGIGYVDMPGLGGLRQRRPDSPNSGWRNKSFQGYADYMLTPEFEANLQDLITLTRTETACLMCAEALPWRCHRSLIADALVVRNIGVRHILSKARNQTHVLRDWACVEATRIIYPPESTEHP